jgi:pimeloyl-ACP methyl ester carboxylesterase
MLGRLLNAATRVWLRRLGFQRRRRRLGDWSVVFYRKGRGGEPWVLLHGLGSNALTWSPVARYLAPDSRVLIPELSILGGTRGPYAGLGVDDGARVMADLLRRELAGEPATVVGLSLGGWTAMRLALAEPSLVSRLILIDAGGYRDQDWDCIRSLVTVRTVADVERLYGALFQRVPWIFKVSKRAFRDVYRSEAVTGVLERLAGEHLCGPAELARLEMPVGMIWAEHDGLFTAAVGRQMARHVRQGAFYLVRGVGHAIHFEAPRQLVEAMEDCRRELPLRLEAPLAGPVSLR